MENISNLDNTYLIDHFLFSKYDDNLLGIVENISYDLDIQMYRNLPYGFNSIKSVKITRKCKQFADKLSKRSWKNNGREYPITLDSFYSSHFDFVRQDVGRSLSLICLLALKTVNDYKNNLLSKGLLFRSDLYNLRQLGIWKNEIELDRLVSDIFRSSKAIKPIDRRYKKLPLVHDFLFDGNEMYNLICWAGSNKKDKSINFYDEKLWLLNITPERISFSDEMDNTFTDSELIDILNSFFPPATLLTNTEFELYKNRLQTNKKLTFFINKDSSNCSEIVIDKNPDRVIDYSTQIENKKYLLESKLNFDFIFTEHTKFPFQGRDKYIKKLKELIGVATPVQNAIFVIGDMGIGKTAFIVNFILKSKKNPIYYFFDHKIKETMSLDSIIRHLYCSLIQKHNRTMIDLNLELDILLKNFSILAQEINDELLLKDNKECIFIDGLEQLLYLPNVRHEILDWFKSLSNYKNIKFIFSSRYFNELEEYFSKDKSNVILIDNSEEDIEKITYSYCENRLKDARTPCNSYSISESSQGNFMYASLMITSILEKEETYYYEEDYLKDLYDNYEAFTIGYFKQVLNTKSIEVFILISILDTYFDKSYGKYDKVFIKKVLAITDKEYHNVIKPLEQFLNVSVYFKEGKLSIYHHSFRNFVVNSYLFKDSVNRVIKQLVLFVNYYIEEKRILDIPEDVFYNYPVYAKEIMDSEKILNGIKKEIIPYFINNKKVDLRSLDPRFLFFCCNLSREIKSSSHIIFYFLINLGRGYLVIKDYKELLDKSNDNLNDSMSDYENLFKKINAKRNAKSLVLCGVSAFIAGKIGSIDLDLLFMHVVYLLRDKFTDSDTTYKLCLKYSKEWV
ncbi:MAG: ATP-binding protein [candidate division Zixibacteria bacterium]|nr:ATP-binding protein [candidate division Zixibacteria bacterium]